MPDALMAPEISSADTRTGALLGCLAMALWLWLGLWLGL
jgi:hypothetical protein